jgi:murein DD-endopeptidase MepM/ murein hydrolase activator NlpD
VLRTPRGAAAAATATFRGRAYPMAADTAAFWVPLGVGADVEAGAYSISVRLVDASGAAIETRTYTLTVVPFEFPYENLEIAIGGPNGLRSADEVVQEENTRAAIFASLTPDKLWNGPFILPVTGPISTEFGTGRSYNGGPVTNHHSGTDFAAPEGTPVLAGAPGRVVFAGTLATRGITVIIDHGLGVFTSYSHMSGMDVAPGASVAAGQQVGLVGMTGLATGPHVHWELVVGGQNVDPVQWTYAGVAP